MIIKSYLAYPVADKYHELKQDLNALSGCEVIPATNRELVVLVTESADEETEAELIGRIEAIATLQALTLVSGYNEAVESARELRMEQGY